MYFVYILYSHKDNKLYIGYTEDLENRFSLHTNGIITSTKNRRPLELIYYEAYRNQLDAKKREIFLKSGSGHRFIKKQMINYFEDQGDGF